ncbi:ER vesicle protein [Saccharomyces pastorianus]|uniref:Endoplasmic reticulum-Golgi intermediate compartment protein n=2 Tax=Saccharomyces TaxID=4930 RepID=A0A6C1ECM0_SACPS|nr:ER vesicle protein [Saccharomyces pastorianus]
MAGLKTFDAFPKTEEQYKKKSTKGGLTSLLTYLFLLFIAWTEFGEYFGGYIDYQYTVDNQVRDTVQINIDLYVNTKCEWLHINVRDQTMDRKLVSEELQLEDMPFFIPYDTKVNDFNEIITPELDEILGEAIPAEFREKLDTRAFFDENDPMNAHLPEFNGCHIFGSVPVNRVSGELQITAKGLGYLDSRKAPLEDLNFAHVINELSYGDFYPYIDNPLDNTAQFNKDEPLTAYVYYTSVVPTLFQKLGAEVDTNQYSVNDYRYSSKDGNTKRVLGIFFKYNFEPLSIVVSDVRLSFVQFLVRLVAICSFLVYCASWIFTFLDMALITVMGPKWSLRYQPDAKSKGILDR